MMYPLDVHMQFWKKALHPWRGVSSQVAGSLNSRPSRLENQIKNATSRARQSLTGTRITEQSKNLILSLMDRSNLWEKQSC